MSLTDSSRNEEMRIYDWAKKNAGVLNILSSNEIDEGSYYTSFEMKDDAVEYGFDTIPQLNAELKKMWMSLPYMQEVMIPCSVGAFKAKPNDAVKKSSFKGKTRDDIVIKDFVYMW